MNQGHIAQLNPKLQLYANQANIVKILQLECQLGLVKVVIYAVLEKL